MKSDFSQGKIWKNIMAQAVPLMLAQLVQLLYNVVDRIYIGHLPGIGSMALTGVGLAFPVTTLIAAFTNLFCTGGAPLFSIARGGKEEDKANRILSQVFSLLLLISVLLFIFCYLFRSPILYAFGASDESIGYADAYLRVYLLGTVFSVIATGMNPFINAQGFPKIGMFTIIIGAALNLVLDPIFIYAMGMGVTGAALATVISQFVSFLWVLWFFFKGKSMYRISKKYMLFDFGLIIQIVSIGLAGFIVQATNCLVQIVCNRTLRMYGGDICVGIMTVLNSVREILSLPASSIGSGAQPILGYNYGAKIYSRVKQSIRFTACVGAVYMAIAWLLIILFPHFFVSLFTSEPEMLSLGTEAIRIYFFGFFFMAFQFSGQSTFTALGCAKRAIFFSLFRKVIIVVPLTIMLPRLGFGVEGVFLAEPISNAVGGIASFSTMLMTLYRKLPEDGMENK